MKAINSICTRWLLLVAAVLTGAFSTAYAQDPPQFGTPFDGVPDTRDINLYQVNIRAFSTGSDLPGVTARLDNIADVGTNVVYLMPVFPVGEDSRSIVSTSASPYSIKGFTSVGSEYGSLADLRTLVEGAHERGMAVILDFIVNQTSWDHPWITEHPDWYIRENGVIQQLREFSDVAALDMNNQAMRAAMIEALRYWVFAANVDGFRFDFANNPPLDFWEQVNGNLRTIGSHDLILFAEGDRLTNFNVDFDLNFGDKWYYDAIRPISTGAAVTTIQNTNNIEYTNANNVQQVARYTGNHDTSGDGTPLEIFGGTAGVMANFVVSAYMRGVPFLYGGQEVAFAQRIPFPWDGVDINWNQNSNVTAEFKKVLDFRTASTAIRRGTLDDYSNPNVCAFTKTADEEKVAVLSNLRSGAATYVIPEAMAGTYADAYTGASVTLTAGESLSLEGFEYLALTTDDVTPPPPPSPTLSVTPERANVAIGATQSLTATVTPADADLGPVSWSSSDPDVATVDADGLVTGVSPGSATITATAGDETATAAITVLSDNSFTVRFFRPVTWGTDINIYYWETQPEGVIPTGSWPGVRMESEGDGWYAYTFNSIASTNLIFNDGANQTDNLSRNQTGWYFQGTWYDTEPDTGGDNAGTVYRLKNRWLDAYLYDDGDQAKYGNVTDDRAQWEQEVVSGYVAFKNKATGDYLNIENERSFVESTATDIGFWSAQWTLEDYDGYQRIRNRWRSDRYVHVEDQLGYAQCSGLFAGSYSNHWTLEPVSASPDTPLSARTGDVSLADDIEVYPVPTEGPLTIRLPARWAHTDLSVQLYDLSGKQVLSKQLNGSSNYQLNIQSLKPSMYMLRMNDGTQTKTVRVLKKE